MSEQRARGTRHREFEYIRRLASGFILIVVAAAHSAAQQSSGAGQGTGQNPGTQSGSGQRAGASSPNSVGTSTQGQSTSQGQPGQSSANPATGNSTGVSSGQSGAIGGLPSQRTAPVTSITGAQQLPGAATFTSAVTELNLEQAIQLAVQNNLATLLAKERQREARGIARELRAGLLPNIAGTAYQANRSRRQRRSRRRAGRAVKRARSSSDGARAVQRGAA